MRKIFLIAILLCSTNCLIAQQPGDLDQDFGNNGKIYSTITGYCNALQIQSDGKIVLGGYRSVDNIPTMLISRINVNGSIDESFGTSGSVILTEKGNNKTYQVISLKIQADNKIVACARFVSRDTSGYNIGVIRLNVDGSFDNSFGDSGVIIIDINKYDEIADMLIQNDGKILITGNTGASESMGNPEFLVRLLINGQIDNSFGANGKVLTSYTSSYKVRAVAQQKDDKIVTSGNYGISTQQYQITRYNSDGSIDTDFGSNGFARLIPSEGTFPLNDMKVQDDGKIICAGGWSIIRFNIDGTADLSFGAGKGYTLLRMTSGYADIKNIFQAKNKKLITTGLYQTGTGTGVATTLYKEDGKIDSAFGENGIAVSGFDNLNKGADISSGVGGIQEDGKIIISGSFPNNQNDDYNISMFRFIGIAETRFVRIKKWLHRHGFTWEDWPGKNISYYAVQRSGNGNNFTEIARLFKRNNQQQFTYGDAAPLTGDNYYRLAAVSADGAVAYSNVLTIPNNTATVKVYPNPAKNNFVIEGLPATAKTKLVITDLNGVARMSAVANSSSYNWNISGLKAGNYILRITNGSNVVTKKFLKE